MQMYTLTRESTWHLPTLLAEKLDSYPKNNTLQQFGIKGASTRGRCTLGLITLRGTLLKNRKENTILLIIVNSKKTKQNNLSSSERDRWNHRNIQALQFYCHNNPCFSSVLTETGLRFSPLVLHLKAQPDWSALYFLFSG